MAELSAGVDPSNSEPLTPLVGQRTDKGRVRSDNEDSILCEPADDARVTGQGLFCAVADGMGGHAAGEVASRMAVETARDVFYNVEAESAGLALAQAIRVANHEIYVAGEDDPSRNHMGSTMTALVIQGDAAVVAHVGDSRCYLLQDGAIRQVTRDHSWVAEQVEAGTLTAEEARTHPRRNVITRALGLRPDVEVEVYTEPLAAGTVLVLCSDGLHGLVTDQEINTIASSLAPQLAAERLVDLANERGGPDNISAIVVHMGPFDEAATIRTARSEAVTPTSVTLPAPIPRPEIGLTAGSEPSHPPTPAPHEAVTARGISAVTPSSTRPPSRAIILAIALIVLALLLLGLGVVYFAVGMLPGSVAAPTSVPAAAATAGQPPVAATAAIAPPISALPATAPPTSLPQALAPATSTASGSSAGLLATLVPTVGSRLPPIAGTLAPAVAETARAIGGGRTDPGTPEPAPRTGVPRTVEVKEASARLREEPSLRAREAYPLVQGDRLDVQDMVQGDTVDGNTTWYMVTGTVTRRSVPFPVRGYIHASLVRVIA
ncbi:MAG: Stp1/IreP family PP2C-type Ser/Thr phosphatase [Chloroflexota bacterium]